MKTLGQALAGIGFRVRFVATLAIAAAAIAPPASAQNMVGPPNFALPSYAGDGLSGVYYDNLDGFSSAQGSQPQASFLTTNVCFPDCQGTEFTDSAGGLAAFTNGNATGITFLNGAQPRTTWNNSELDMSGYIAITQPGNYNFLLNSDDSSYLFIQGQQVGSLNHFSQPGLYAITIQFFEFGGGSRLDFTGDSLVSGQTCILGCYVGGQLQPNSLFYSDAQIEGAPAPKIGAGWSGAAVLALFGAAGLIRRRTLRAA